MKKFIKPTLAIALGLFASQSATAAELAIEQGTMSLGGEATFNMAMADGATIISVNIAPSAGYFVTDSIELFGGLQFGLVSFAGESSTFLGLGLGGNYYVDAGSMKIYFGVNTNMDFLDGVNVAAGAQAGLLLGLSENVAIDIGIRPTYHIAGINEGVFELGVGAVGVRSFF